MDLIKGRGRRKISDHLFSLRYSDLSALNYFEITDEDLMQGIVFVKAKVKKAFRKKALRWHPDIPSPYKGRAKTGSTFMLARKRYNTVMLMNILPVSVFDLAHFLNLIDGYEVMETKRMYVSWL